MMRLLVAFIMIVSAVGLSAGCGRKGEPLHPGDWGFPREYPRPDTP